jgi:hypothetical protein
VYRAFASSLLSLLLVLTLVWGGCLSCEQYFMWSSTKGCCSANGHCKTKSRSTSPSGRECKQIAFEQQKSLQVQADLPVIAVLPGQPFLPPVSVRDDRPSQDSIDPSPPDRQALHATFLI